ncbi:MAG: helicase-related protein [Bacteroidales bacterium]|jgi:SNF2 family DNA or RNA helicase|nr:helicase-related protein [Bacteroidales bacterium]
MLYKGKAIEIVGVKDVFEQKVVWIRILEDNSFLQVAYEEMEVQVASYSMSYLRFISIAAKIKDEIAKKNILAPYESSLLPLPHQILVLEKVMQSVQNRFLLADEVGMGKTIEAGLILKELKLRGDIKRTLIIVPKSAMMQWQSELKEHFNEVFHLYDSEMISSLARTFSNINADQEFNFWQQHNQIIVSTDALKPIESRQGWSKERIDEYNKYRIEAVLEANFEMIVIDEAHKMGGANQTVSRYILAQALCNSVPNVLLLTATPHRGKADHFRRILQLLDPEAFAGEGLPGIKELEPYVIRTEKRLAIDYEGKKLFNERETARFDVILDINKHQKQTELYTAVTDYVKKGFNSAKRSKNNATGLIMILFQKLVSSSTAAILSAMQGRFERLIEGSDDDIESYGEELDQSEDATQEEVDYSGVHANFDEGIENEEKILSDLIEQAKDCIRTEIDAKADALLKKYQELQQTYNDKDLKIIIFTEFRTTQKMLKDFFTNRGYRCSIINGGQDLDERKIALSNFKNNTQMLIGTDAAGESLNMQFCHIVFNYDLPWNPMTIEQRIGRVDRIGQKHKVKAFNMLPNNSVDLRVYEVIEEKLTNILEQLGIDKTSDVLDSAIDIKKVNTLYLQSLLDPTKFEFAGEKWLYEIKTKLKDYQSTEGVLPEVKEDEIDYKKASEIKHSPLPQWLEELIVEYTKMNEGSIVKSIFGYLDVQINVQRRKITFDKEVSLNNPGAEHITLQHDWINRILSDVGEFDSSNGIPVLKSNKNDETTGTWSLWQITAHNHFDRKTTYQSFFIADNGKQYHAYANDIWNRLIAGEKMFKLESTLKEFETNKIDSVLRESLFTTFQNLEADVMKLMQVKKENRLKSYEFQKLRISKIGIENIRLSKQKKLEDEQIKWLKEFDVNQKIIPGTKHLLTIRIDG